MTVILPSFYTARFRNYSVVRFMFYTVIHNYRTPSFEQHNLVNIRFISTKISTLERDILLCEVVSEFQKYVLPLPCNISIYVTVRHGLDDWSD